jgi:hypothetical protein
MGIEFVLSVAAAGAFLRAQQQKRPPARGVCVCVCVRYQRRVISDSTAKKGQGPPPLPLSALYIHTLLIVFCYGRKKRDVHTAEWRRDLMCKRVA